MAKAAIITDLHFGARNDSLHFDAFFKQFYETVFFPTLDKEGVSVVFLLGDIFDRRKYINFQILKNCKKYFFDELEERNITVIAIVGNHDVYFKNTNDVNSPNLLLREYNNIRMYQEPTEVVLDKKHKILLMPWITLDTVDSSINLLQNTEAKYCFGHFEIAGFEMHRGEIIDTGLDRSVFKKFDFVLSGHFHHRSSNENIHYLGNPYEITWSDYDDPRGFHLIDTNTMELTFVPNPYRMFYKIAYDDTKKMNQDLSELSGKYVKLVVVNKTDFFKFDQYLDKLYSVNPAELKILEDFEEFEAAEVDESVDLEDTLSLLDHYVEAVVTDMDKLKIKTTLKTLYVEAIAEARDD